MISLKLIKIAWIYTFIIVFLLSMIVAGATASSIIIIADDNGDIVINTQAVVLTSLEQDNLTTTGFVYSEDLFNGLSQDNVDNGSGFSDEGLNNPVEFILSEAYDDTPPPNFVYGSQVSNENKPASQPETETDLGLSDSATLPYSGGVNYFSVVALWLFILASYFMKKGIVGEKVLDSHNF